MRIRACVPMDAQKYVDLLRVSGVTDLDQFGVICVMGPVVIDLASKGWPFQYVMLLTEAQCREIGELWNEIEALWKNGA